jgi:hypothetical protein
MENREPHDAPRFYFSLPRLIVKLSGGNPSRSERSWIESTIAGGAVHAIVFAFSWHLLLAALPLWKQALLLLPLVVLVLLSWIAFFYLNAQLIKLMRRAGLFRHLANFRIHSVVIGIIVTLFAARFALAGSSILRAIGLVWIVAVLLNQIAAALLFITHAEQPAAE